MHVAQDLTFINFLAGDVRVIFAMPHGEQATCKYGMATRASGTRTFFETLGPGR